MKSKLVLLATLLASHAAFSAEVFQCDHLKDSQGNTLSGSYGISLNGSEATLIVACDSAAKFHCDHVAEFPMKKVAQEPEASTYKGGGAVVTIEHFMGRDLGDIQVGNYAGNCFTE